MSAPTALTSNSMADTLLWSANDVAPDVFDACVRALPLGQMDGLCSVWPSYTSERRARLFTLLIERATVMPFEPAAVRLLLLADALAVRRSPETKAQIGHAAARWLRAMAPRSGPPWQGDDADALLRFVQWHEPVLTALLPDIALSGAQVEHLVAVAALSVQSAVHLLMLTVRSDVHHRLLRRVARTRSLRMAPALRQVLLAYRDDCDALDAFRVASLGPARARVALLGRATLRVPETETIVDILTLLDDRQLGVLDAEDWAFLCGHTAPEVREAALLAMGRIPPSLSPSGRRRSRRSRRRRALTT
jgi:hypothetical protein